MHLREDCRTLADSLQLEMVVAQYLLQIRDVRSPEGIPIGDAVGAGVVARLEAERDPLSHAILRGVAQLATGETGRRSAEAAARLAELGVAVPDPFAGVASSTPRGAWRADDDEVPGQYCLFGEFEHPDGRRHSVMAFIEPRRGGRVKHLGLIGALSEIEGRELFDPEAIGELPLADAGPLFEELLERTYGPDGTASDDYRVPIALARARAMAGDGA